MNQKRVSVVMATYNGEKYIKEQISSILSQLNDNDELIISDDGSTDNTINIIKSFNSNLITLINGPKKGVKLNFANAIDKANGKYIFLSDQDDLWVNGKVISVLNTFDTQKCQCVVHDCDVISNNEIIINSFFEHRNSSSGILKNLWKNRYLGCCMAFTSDMKKYILPIPNDIEMHDQWIGIICEKHGQSVFLKNKLIHYRRHGNNVSSLKHYPLWKMVKNRVVFIFELIGR